MPKAKRTLQTIARTKVDKDSAHQATHTLIFDYTDVTYDELMRQHARQGKIDWQREYRKAPTMFPEDVAVEINVKATMTGGNAVQITPQMVRSYIASLSDEERAKFVAEAETETEVTSD